MNQKGFTKIFILAGIVLIGAALAGTYYFGKSSVKSPAPQSQSNSVSPTLSGVKKATKSSDITQESTSNKEPSTTLRTETINFKQNPAWSTYTDKIAKFTVQYPPKHKVADASQEGKEIYFWDCGLNDPNRGQICVGGFTLRIYNDYDQGSRRTWLNKKFQLYQPYYQDFIIDGKKALVAIEGNPGGSSELFIAIPNGSMMVVYSQSMVAWDPTTGKLPDLTYSKQILSTFKFTN